MECRAETTTDRKGQQMASLQVTYQSQPFPHYLAETPDYPYYAAKGMTAEQAEEALRRLILDECKVAVEWKNVSMK